MRLGVRGLLIAMLLVSILPPSAGVVRADAIPVVTHHNDLQRTGANLSETTLTTSNVNQTAFGKLFSLPLDGNSFGKPLYVPGLTIGGATRNVVFAATMHNSVYAFNADTTGEPLWKRTLPDVPVPLPNKFCCGDEENISEPDGYQDIRVEMGILSTPTIDTATNTMYVVAMGLRAQSGGFFCALTETYASTVQNGRVCVEYRLHALDLLTGASKFASSRVIEASVPGSTARQDPNAPGNVIFEAARQTPRPALALHNGSIYIGFGSFKDDGPYHGWLMRYDKTTLARQAVFASTPETLGGGLWGSGAGPVIDPTTGDVYITNANGQYETEGAAPDNYADSVIRLDKDDLTVTGHFSPHDNVCAEGRNNCFGAAMGMMIPGTNLFLAVGKIGRFFLINRLSPDLGGRGNGPMGRDNVVQTLKATRTQPACLSPNATDPADRRLIEACKGRIYTAPVYWNGPDGPYIYIWPRFGALMQYKFDPALNEGAGGFATAPDTEMPPAVDNYIPFGVPYKERPYVAGQAGSDYTPDLAGGALALSANGGQGASGIIWALRPVTVPPERIALSAYNAADVTQKLWDSRDNAARDDMGYMAKFHSPTVVNGKVYATSFFMPNAPANDPLNANRLHVYGLLAPPSALTATATGFPTLVAANDAKAITVTVRKQDGSIATGYTGTMRFTSSDPAALLPPPRQFTAADMGQFAFVVRFRTPGTHTLTVTDTSAGGITATQSGITVFGATGVSPESGGTAGGNPVTIIGVNFVPGATVTFGGVAAPVMSVSPDGTKITVIAPPRMTPGTVDVAITINGSRFTLPQEYTYGIIQPAPAPMRPALPTVSPSTPVGVAPQPARVAATLPAGMSTPLPAPPRR